jgi:hypothetical protein
MRLRFRCRTRKNRWLNQQSWSSNFEVKNNQHLLCSKTNDTASGLPPQNLSCSYVCNLWRPTNECRGSSKMVEGVLRRVILNVKVRITDNLLLRSRAWPFALVFGSKIFWIPESTIRGGCSHLFCVFAALSLSLDVLTLSPVALSLSGNWQWLRWYCCLNHKNLDKRSSCSDLFLRQWSKKDHESSCYSRH